LANLARFLIRVEKRRGDSIITEPPRNTIHAPLHRICCNSTLQLTWRLVIFYWHRTRHLKSVGPFHMLTYITHVLIIFYFFSNVLHFKSTEFLLPLFDNDKKKSRLNNKKNLGLEPKKIIFQG